MGRKPISGTRKLDKLVIRLTNGELASIDRAASVIGLPSSTWARNLILSAAGHVPTDEPGEAAAPAKKIVRRASGDPVTAPRKVPTRKRVAE